MRWLQRTREDATSGRSDDARSSVETERKEGVADAEVSEEDERLYQLRQAKAESNHTAKLGALAEDIAKLQSDKTKLFRLLKQQ